jgi:hypothetical protein
MRLTRLVAAQRAARREQLALQQRRQRIDRDGGERDRQPADDGEGATLPRCPAGHEDGKRRDQHDGDLLRERRDRQRQRAQPDAPQGDGPDQGEDADEDPERRDVVEQDPPVVVDPVGGHDEHADGEDRTHRRPATRSAIASTRSAEPICR